MSALLILDLLRDQRVRVLVTAAQQAHKALTRELSLSAQRKAAENLAFALEAFEVDIGGEQTSPKLRTIDDLNPPSRGT
jgi:hypothetical protein